MSVKDKAVGYFYDEELSACKPSCKCKQSHWRHVAAGVALTGVCVCDAPLCCLSCSQIALRAETRTVSCTSVLADALAPSSDAVRTACCAANFNYGGGNPMRPHRVRLTHSLVKNYGLNKRLLVHRPQPRNDDELEMFHADGACTRCLARALCVVSACRPGSRFVRWRADYVTFLKNVTPDNQDEYMVQMRRFNLGPVGEADCPVFDGMFEYCAVCIFYVQMIAL